MRTICTQIYGRYSTDPLKVHSAQRASCLGGCLCSPAASCCILDDINEPLKTKVNTLYSSSMMRSTASHVFIMFIDDY